MFWPPFSISPDRKGETSKRQGRKAQTSHPLLSGCLLPTSGPVSTWAAVTSETSATSRDMRGINFCGRGKQVCPSPVAAELSKFFVRRGLQSIIRWRWDSQGLQAILHSLNSTTTPPFHPRPGWFVLSVFARNAGLCLLAGDHEYGTATSSHFEGVRKTNGLIVLQGPSDRS